MHVRTARDHEGLKEIGGIVALVLDRLAQAARPGLATLELDQLAARLLDEWGAGATPRKEYNFPGHLCISINEEIVHGVPSGRLLQKGDLIKLDLTADKNGFVADATRMVLLPPADPAIRLLANCAVRACQVAIAEAKPGLRLKELGRIIETETDKRGFHVLRELCGHGVGRRIHEEPEVPNYPDRSNVDMLEEGMVIAIEPIICQGRARAWEADDGWTMRTSNGSWAAHYEETLIIRASGAEVVTAIPASEEALGAAVSGIWPAW